MRPDSIGEVPPPPELGPSRARFVQEYLVDLNATQAAIRAGYSAKTASVQGIRLLRNAQIAAAVQAGKRENELKSGITRKRVLRELEAIAFSNHTNFEQDDKGRLVLREGVNKRAHKAVASVEYKTLYDSKGAVSGREVKFKLWDKPSMLKLAGQHVGLFSDKDKGDEKPTEIHVHVHDKEDLAPPVTANTSTT